MKGTDIRAWTYDADIHCLNCARERFGADVTEYPWKEKAADSEGNEPHPVFESDEVSPSGEYCGTCFDEIAEPYSDEQPI